jgi:hypothetical protein
MATRKRQPKERKPTPVTPPPGPVTSQDLWKRAGSSMERRFAQILQAQRSKHNQIGSQNRQKRETAPRRHKKEG